jgi:hypothetical protein
MVSQPSGARVNIFANDPLAKGLHLEQVPLPTGKSPFAIPGWTGAGGLFEPGSVEFQAGQLFVVLTQTYSAWTEFFGEEFGWKSGAAALPVYPRAGVDLQAYYDQTSLRFQYGTDPKTNQTVYSCESSDIVAHECGHAVLDAHQPDYWHALFPETGAFHESFGDISALLVTLGDPAVRAVVLAETRGDLTKSNVASRLGEQMARAGYDTGHAADVVSPNALRDAINPFKYRVPEKLPASAPFSKLSSGSHNFSRVFTGAFYDLLVGIYIQLREENIVLSADAALAQARSDAGRLIARAVDLAPKGDVPFSVHAASMITADALNFGGKYFKVLRQAFVRRKILTASVARQLKVAGASHLKTSGLVGTAGVSIGTPLTIDPASASMGEDLPASYRKAASVPKREFQLVERRTLRNAGQVLHYATTRSLELKGKALGSAGGVMVDLTDSVAFQIAGDGHVLSTHYHQSDRAHEKRIRDHVEKIVASGRVYSARAGEIVDPAELMKRKQPYYILYDHKGNKRIRRAFIACGDDCVMMG